MQNKLLASVVIILLLLGISVTQTNAQQIHDSTEDKKEVDTMFLFRPDTVYLKAPDTVLRIKNFTPYFTLHVDSTLRYQFEINRNPEDYYWYLKNPPVGLRIEDGGLLYFKPTKAFFLSGKLKYDKEYNVTLGVQNLNDASDRLDTTFTIVFYNTDIVQSRLKPTIASESFMDEGDTLKFKIQCETGSFPIESITYLTNYPIRSTTAIRQCGDDFTWVAPYDFIKDSEKAKTKQLILRFVGVDKFFNRDTAQVIINVRDGINYVARTEEFNQMVIVIENYIEQLKSTFMFLDQKVKHTRKSRTTFDLTSATTALGGTVFSSMKSDDARTAGTIMPSVGVALVPVKEAVAPNKANEQNSATLVRSDIQRLQYLLNNTMLIGDRDEEIERKTQKLRDELKQIQLQLIDVPMVDASTNKEEVDKYFNSPKVKKKYRLKRGK